MSIVQEFKEFALKGNVVDLAVGVVIGAAFGKIVSSLVDNVVMPPLGLLLGGVDFTYLGVVLKEGVGEQKPVILAYGRFLQAVFDFLIVALAIFSVIKGMNSLRRTDAAPPPPAEPPAEEKLLTEIRDLLKAQR